jgi:hypothetical protein
VRLVAATVWRWPFRVRLPVLGITNRTSKSALGDVLFERKPTGSDQFSMFTVDAGVGRNPSPAGPVGPLSVAAFSRT